MSRIGNRILSIPDGVSVEVKDLTVKVTGPKGSLEQKYKPEIKIEVKDNKISVIRSNEEKQTKQLHGTYNSLINGMIQGVTQGFKKELEINGVGYKAAMKGNTLNLSVGFSHDVNIDQPQGITISTPSATEIIVEGIDKQLVGETAAIIRAWKKPEPYKGKGIKYKGEHIIRKVGKTAGK